MKLGVVIPYAQEWPQIAFTIRAVHEELLDVQHEIIAVDNMCEQLWDQIQEMDHRIDRGHARIELRDKSAVPAWYSLEEADVKERHESAIGAAAGRLPWLKYLNYTDKLSHWNCKRVGCDATDAEIFLFLDAHVSPSRGSLSGMYNYYVQHWEELNGTLHAPLTYHILEEHKLIYKLVYERGLFGYTFTGYREATEPYEVPVMSTCGMMMHRSYLAGIGGWPVELGIYGGGENFVNGALAVTGKKKWIMPGAALHHHGDKRGYHYEWMDHKRNQALAMFLIDNKSGAMEFVENLKPYKTHPSIFVKMVKDLMKTSAEHRKFIDYKQNISIKDFVKRWTTRD